MKVYVVRHDVHVVPAQSPRQPRRQDGRAVPARRASTRRSALHQRQLHVPDRPGLQRGRPADLPGTVHRPRARPGPRAVAHALDRHLRPRQVAGEHQPDAEPRPALRPAHLAGQELVQPVLLRSRCVPDRQEQPPAAGRLRLQHRRPVGDARRLRPVLREAVDRSLRAVPAEPRLLRFVHRGVSRSTPPIPGPSNGPPADRPVPGQRPDRQSRADRQPSTARAP